VQADQLFNHQNDVIMKKFILSLALVVGVLCCSQLQAQVTTNFNNDKVIDSRGRFAKAYDGKVDFEIPAKDIKQLQENERRAQPSNGEGKPFEFADPVAVDINLPKAMNWTSDGDFTYGRYAIKANGAMTTSINFDQFFLPERTEMYVYNAKGNMITGPITEKENNANKFWGSWMYKGEDLFVEIKTPTATLDKLELHTNNIAYGYKEIYKTKVANFGASGACEINVLCPLGLGWEAERNSVALILNASSNALCTGALVMNTCGTDQPYFLTANHCFTAQGGQNVGLWKFTFQAWSPNCTPSANSAGITFNGSTFRANFANSDMCLVELNTKPAANSGIHYAGWTRSTTPATSGVAIHHPAGDVMKISDYITPLVREDNAVRCGVGTVGVFHWVVQWNQGVTEGGSSGSPLFDQNHRIVGQLAGGPSSCAQPPACRMDMYGRFDNSWTGGGTNATRLSNWLDPGGTGATTTNTTNVSGLHPFLSNNFNLMSYDDNLDVGNEPNTQSTNIWQSNDIWNRRNTTGSPNDHQEPGYSNPTFNNIMKLRIRNVGCKASPVAHAKMYWTMASMGEQWQVDWDGTSQLCGVAASGEVTTPNTGQTYVAGSGFQVPALQPNQTFIVEGKWKPKNPLIDYACMQPGMGAEPMICFLGRILSTLDPMANEVLGPIGPNVKNNNNIVTRNTKLVNLPGSYKLASPVGGTVLAHNYLDVSTRFNIRFSAATSSDIRFNQIGTAVINLSDRMWDAWIRGGGVAEGMELTNDERHEFTIRDPRSAMLGNIEMRPDEYMSVGAGFILNQPTDNREEYRFVMSQEVARGAIDGSKPFTGSDGVFVVIISDEEFEAVAAEQGGGDVTTVGTTGTLSDVAIDRRRAAVSNSNTLVAKPNPASDRVTLQFNMPQSGSVSVTLSDANGRIVKSLVDKQVCNKGANQLPVNVSGIKAGTYIITLSSPAGRQTTRLVINH